MGEGAGRLFVAGTAACSNGAGEANDGAATVSATANATTAVGVDGAAMGIGSGGAEAGMGGIAGRGKFERDAGAASGHDGAMNGAGVIIVTTSSNSGAIRGLASAGGAGAGRAAATGAARVGAAGFALTAGAALPSLPTTGLGRAAAATPLAGAPDGNLGPGGPIPRVVARCG